jgi:putative membrane protein
MLAKFIVRAIFGALGLWLSSVLVAGVHFSDNTSLILAAVLLGIVNAFVRPVVFVLTLPLTVVTLGLFLLVVNAAMIGLVAWFLSGFQVNGLIPGILAAIITGVTSWIGGMILRDDRR